MRIPLFEFFPLYVIFVELLYDQLVTVYQVVHLIENHIDSAVFAKLHISAPGVFQNVISDKSKLSLL